MISKASSINLLNWASDPNPIGGSCFWTISYQRFQTRSPWRSKHPQHKVFQQVSETGRDSGVAKRSHMISPQSSHFDHYEPWKQGELIGVTSKSLMNLAIPCRTSSDFRLRSWRSTPAVAGPDLYRSDRKLLGPLLRFLRRSTWHVKMPWLSSSAFLKSIFSHTQLAVRIGRGVVEICYKPT